MIISICNKNIYYEFINQADENADKPMIVFLHEGLGSERQWLKFPEKLCRETGLSGLIYDRYGYGRSENNENPRKVDFMHIEALEFLPELLNKLQIKNKLILFGHSDGASISLIFASAYSHLLLGVISEAAHVIIEDISRAGIVKMRANYFNSISLRKLFAKYHGEKADHLVDDWTCVLLSDDFKTWNIEPLLSLIQVPILAIQGDNDEYGSYYQLDSLKNHSNAKTEILYIENCGHIPHQQAQDITMSAVVNFIRALLKTSNFFVQLHF